MTSKPCGFSLIELTLVMVLIGILTGFAVNMFTDTIRVGRIVAGETRSISESHLAMERLIREIREISWDDAAGGYEAPVRLGSRLVFTKRWAGAPTTVEIQYVGNQILLGSSPPGIVSPLLSNVTNFNLSYKRGNLSSANSPGNLRIIEVQFTHHPPDTSPINLRSHAFLRNFE